MKTFITFLIATLTMASTPAFAIQINNSSNKVLGQASVIKCGAGLTCTMGTTASGPQAAITVSGGAGSFTTLSASGAITPSGGIKSYDVTALFTNFSAWLPAVAVSEATSATPSSTVLDLTQIFIPANVTLTGINVLNAATCGTNKWIVALFDDTGAPVANSALAGTLCSGTSAFQTIAFTGTYAAKGPGTYWIGLYADGATDRYYSVPAFGKPHGLAGTVTGQTFGTVVAVTLPTSFTADKGPVAYTY